MIYLSYPTVLHIDGKCCIVQAIRSQWERFGNMSFDWVGDCPTSGSSKLIRLQVVLGTDQGGGASLSVGPAALRSSTEGASGTFNIPLSGSLSRLQYLGVHEFGHLLGFGHENDRTDNPDTTNCGPGGTRMGTFFTPFDTSSIMKTNCNVNNNSSGELSAGDKSGVVKAYGAAIGGMLLSDTNSGLAINAFGGAKHLAPLKLVSNCSKNNPDCTWTYRDGMLLSDTDPSLAINAYGGAQNQGALKLVNNCSKNNSDCTWTYRKGMFFSDTNPTLSINAFGGARHGADLLLVNNCRPELTDCTWTHQNTMIQSGASPQLRMKAGNSASPGASLLLSDNCSPTDGSCSWILHKGMIISASNPGLVVNAFGGAAHQGSLVLVNNCTENLSDCTFTLGKGVIMSDTNPSLMINAFGGARANAKLLLVNNCTSSNNDCLWVRSRAPFRQSLNQSTPTNDSENEPPICKRKPNLPQCRG